MFVPMLFHTVRQLSTKNIQLTSCLILSLIICVFFKWQFKANFHFFNISRTLLQQFANIHHDHAFVTLQIPLQPHYHTLITPVFVFTCNMSLTVTFAFLSTHSIIHNISKPFSCCSLNCIFF